MVVMRHETASGNNVIYAGKFLSNAKLIVNNSHYLLSMKDISIYPDSGLMLVKCTGDQFSECLEMVNSLTITDRGPGEC